MLVTILSCTYCINMVVVCNDSYSTALVAHGRDQGPLVSLWVIALCGLQELTPVKSTTYVDLNKKNRGGWGGGAIRNGHFCWLKLAAVFCKQIFLFSVMLHCVPLTLPLSVVQLASLLSSCMGAISCHWLVSGW